jgi:hypothetical protein
LAKKLARWTAIAVINIGVLGVLLDLIVAVFLLFPSWLRVAPRGLADTIRQVYADRIRHVIQLNPDQSIVDSELLYRLRPGRFTFANREFSTPFEVNSLGVRDREDALRGPQIVVAGDSYAMGWGVGQEETFAKVLERSTGMRVLNAGVSSYGTARELTLLRRIDTSRMRYLIIQYCDNDLPENRAFIENGYHHKTGDVEAFRRLRENEASRTRYLPFKFALALTEAAARRVRERRWPVPTDAEHADAFVQVLTHGPWRLDSVQVIVFDMDERRRDTSGFVAALRARITRPDEPPFIHTLEVLDVSPALTPGMFYDLDNHLRPEGHRVIAGALQRALAGAR